MFKTRYVIVTDFEATCWENDPSKRDQMEIIEIGSLKVETATLKQISEFGQFIRPQRTPLLTNFCKSLTTITQDQVDKAKPFPEVFQQWVGWMGTLSDVTFASWGRYDYNQLVQDCTFHKLAVPVFGDVVNIKTTVAEKLGTKPSGVGKMVSRLGLKFEGTPHRGIDDAKNILKIVQRCA